MTYADMTYAELEHILLADAIADELAPGYLYHPWVAKGKNQYIRRRRRLIWLALEAWALEQGITR